MKRGVIIVAGGSGNRLGSDIPKQYVDLAGQPVIWHTLNRFLRFDSGMLVVVVIGPGHGKYWEPVERAIGGTSVLRLATGGPNRFTSVASGLEMVEDGIVLGIHDAARPLVSVETLNRCYDAAFRNGSAIPVVELEESVRYLEEKGAGKETHSGFGGSEPLDRTRVVKVQTPQVFRSEEIKEAYGQAHGTGFTDDATVYESLHGRIHLVEGNRENIKITTPADLRLVRLLMESGA